MTLIKVCLEQEDECASGSTCPSHAAAPTHLSGSQNAQEGHGNKLGSAQPPGPATSSVAAPFLPATGRAEHPGHRQPTPVSAPRTSNRSGSLAPSRQTAGAVEASSYHCHRCRSPPEFHSWHEQQCSGHQCLSPAHHLPLQNCTTGMPAQWKRLLKWGDFLLILLMASRLSARSSTEKHERVARKKHKPAPWLGTCGRPPCA